MFWKNRINPLKRDKKLQDGDTLGAWAVDRQGAVVAVMGTGELYRYSSVQAFLAAALDYPAPYTWYTHMSNGANGDRRDVARVFDHAEAFDALADAGYTVRVFESGGRTAALEVFPPDADSTGAPVAHHSFRDLGVVLTTAVPRDAASAATKTLQRVLDLAGNVHERFGTHLEMTATRTGYQAWRRTLAEPYYRQPAAARRDIRKAYRGGYTRAFRTGNQAGTWRQYDIRSAYPAAMRRGVPVGQPVAIGQDGDRDPRYAGMPGFYYVDAFLRPRGLPVLLGWDTESKADVPLGGDYTAHVRLWVTSQEWQLAQDLGVVGGVLRGWVYPGGLANPFDQFVDTCEEWRNATTTGSANQLVKLIQNTLYGKFGTEPVQREVVISTDIPDAGEGEPFMPHYGAHAPCDVAWSRPVNTDGNAGQMVHWAAWITATVRVQVIRTIAQLGPEHVLYVDTDCIITDGEMPTGDRYGDWVLQRVYTEFQAFGGKRYVGRTIDGEQVLKHAGISGTERPQAILERLMAGEARARGDPG